MRYSSSPYAICSRAILLGLIGGPLLAIVCALQSSAAPWNWILFILALGLGAWTAIQGGVAHYTHSGAEPRKGDLVSPIVDLSRKEGYLGTRTPKLGTVYEVEDFNNYTILIRTGKGRLKRYPTFHFHLLERAPARKQVSQEAF